MSLNSETAQRLFDTGEYGRLIEQAGHTIGDSRFGSGIRIIVAQALLHAGQPKKAQELAATCSNAPSVQVRARALLVLGLEARAAGRMTAAQSQLQAALRLAEEGKDAELALWAQLHLFRHLVEHSPRALATAMVQTVRTRVTRAGSAQATAYLHGTVGILEGQVGRLREARRHCLTAETILALAPHAWLSCSILGVRASIALAGCAFKEAQECLAQLQAVARRHGLARDLSQANVNIGHLAAMLGDYDAAELALTDVRNSALTSQTAKLAATETLARIRLAQGRLGECDQLIQSIDAEATLNPALSYTFSVQWAAITKARLLLRRGHAKSAIEGLRSFERSHENIFDRPLAAAIGITAAQASAASDHPAEAARRLAACDLLGATSFPELQGQYYYAAASTVAVSDPGLAHGLRTRARRLWNEQGIASVEREFGATTDHTDGGPNESTESPSAGALVDSITSVLDLSRSPQLLARGLLSAIAHLECSPKARIVERSTDRTPDEPNCIHLTIGEEGERTIAIACDIPETPAKALALAGVLRVGRAAIELERLRESERGRAALWPESSAEEQAGAVFSTDEMRAVLSTARRIAATTIPVLITGETGTGKEVLARLIHAYSQRARAVFVPFNCTSMPRDMLESQLFGHRRGSFTGATEHFQGVTRAANHGTLLLDEIGDMSLDVQPKLLRFLESNEIHPVGESRPIEIDVRVIAATNCDLEERVSRGEFREDLYYRLNIVPLRLPPLRERRGEIPTLAAHYLEKYRLEFEKGDLRLAEDTMEYLLLYRWPGNIRQLANEMRRMAAIAEPGAVLTPEHLSSDIAKSRRTLPASELSIDADEVVVRLDQPIAAATEHLERTMVSRALRRCGGRIDAAAKILGLSRKGLYLKRQRYQLEETLTAGAEEKD